MVSRVKSDTKIENVRYVMLEPENNQIESAAYDINFSELWSIIWKGRWLIVCVVTLCSFFSIIYALSLPNIYKSEALLAPASSEQQSGLGTLSGQFGGLASLAGINLGSGKSDKTALAIEILKSREFLTRFIQKHNILPDIMAAEGWDLNTNKVKYDTELYNSDTNKWFRDVKPPLHEVPSMQEANTEFNKFFSVNEIEETGMITINTEHFSPYVAKQWVDWLIQDINLVMKNRDKEEAERSIEYLQSQIGKTSISEHKTLLYELIEEQAKTLMFAEVRDEYVFKTIDPALVAEQKIGPKRALICFLGVLLGMMFGLMLVLVVGLIRKRNSMKN